MRFDARIARWVCERQHYAFLAEAPVNSEAGPVMVYHVQVLSELIPWLLGWGRLLRLWTRPSCARSFVRRPPSLHSS